MFCSSRICAKRPKVLFLSKDVSPLGEKLLCQCFRILTHGYKHMHMKIELLSKMFQHHCETLKQTNKGKGLMFKI